MIKPEIQSIASALATPGILQKLAAHFWKGPPLANDAIAERLIG